MILHFSLVYNWRECYNRSKREKERTMHNISNNTLEMILNALNNANESELASQIENEILDYGDDDDLIDGVGFASSGSALRAETSSNPRSYPCPTCGTEDILTQLDVARGYQCDACADRDEGKSFAW